MTKTIHDTFLAADLELRQAGFRQVCGDTCAEAFEYEDQDRHLVTLTRDIDGWAVNFHEMVDFL